jgi:cell division protein FtsB
MPNEFYRKDRKRFDVPWMLRKLLRNKRLMLLLAGGLLLSGYVLFGSRGVVQRIRLKNQKAELQTMIQQAESDNRRLQAESKALDGDKKTIEKVAREKYGMVRDGETVYKVRKKE